METSETAYIYRCEITLWEHTFFASREISAFFQTEPLIGNYALAYALGLCAAPYHSDATVRYKEDLAPLNECGVYVTPATVCGKAKFTQCQFNAQADTYWYAFANNAIVVRPDDRHAVHEGSNWYLIDPTGSERKKVTASNFPQHGTIKMLALGNRAVCYIISHDLLDHHLPHYIRLGKWMSKAGVQYTKISSRKTHRSQQIVEVFLNPADLPDPKALKTFDLVSVHPVPLIRQALLDGWFYQSPDGIYLPAGMRFGVERLP